MPETNNSDQIIANLRSENDKLRSEIAFKLNQVQFLELEQVQLIERAEAAESALANKNQPSTEIHGDPR